MSLEKSYKLMCDAPTVLVRRDVNAGVNLETTRAARIASEHDCKLFSTETITAPEARKAAKAEGWVRWLEHKQAYDLCPVCAPKIIPAAE